MYTKGFTLIELLVSVTIFIVVMVISLGALLSISSAEKKAESLKTVMNNLNFGLDSMTRAIRIGTTYHCGSSGTISAPQDCSGGQSYFAFETYGGSVGNTGDQAVYKLGSGTSECGASSTGGCIVRSLSSGAANTFTAITAPEVNITGLTFYVVGATPEFQGDSTHSQPKVIITLTGQVTLSSTQTTSFDLQTSVTQRLYDL